MTVENNQQQINIETPANAGGQQVENKQVVAPEVEKKGDNGSILGNETPNTKEVAPKYPDTWREGYAKDDKSKLEILKRYTSPEAAFDALFEARKKISSGLKSELPKDATPEQMADYRKELGIPEKPEDYKIQLKDGFVIGDEDKPIVDKVLSTMHAKNINSDVVSEVLNSFYEARQAEEDAEYDLIIESKAKAQESLKAEWGVEYNRNKTIIEGFIEKRFGEDASAIFGARLPDGSILGSNPKVLNKLYTLAADADPEITILNSLNNRGTLDSISDRIAEIKNIIKTDEARYYKDESLQSEYGRLLTAQQTLSKK